MFIKGFVYVLSDNCHLDIDCVLQIFLYHGRNIPINIYLRDNFKASNR